MPTTPPFLAINAARIQDDLDALARFTDPEKPYTRRAFTPLYREARTWLEQRMADAGLDVRVDPAGNLIGRLRGKANDGSVLMVGSHTDTVERPPRGNRWLLRSPRRTHCPRQATGATACWASR